MRLTQPELAKRPHPPAELARYGQRAVIVVNPTRTLEQWTGVSLVPLPDGRALISFERPRSIAEVELTISDAIADHRLSRTDQATFKAIEEILRAARRSKDVTLQQRSIIVLETRRRARTSSSKPARRSRPAPADAGHSGGGLPQRSIELSVNWIWRIERDNLEVPDVSAVGSAGPRRSGVRRRQEPDNADPGGGDLNRARTRVPRRQRTGSIRCARR